MQRSRQFAAPVVALAMLCSALVASCAREEAVQTPATVAERVSPQSELYALAMAYLQACVTRDTAYVSANSIDDPSGSFTGIITGTATDWSLQATIADLAGAKPVSWEGLDPIGYQVGDFAWFTDVADGVIPSGQHLTIRVTLLMRRVDGVWKVAHFHVSEGLQREGIRREDQ